MTTSQKVIGAVAVLGVILGAVALLLPHSTPSTATTFGNTSVDGSQSNLPNPSNFDYLVARLALGYQTNLSVNGTGANNINVEAQRANMVSTSTVICAIQNPFNATSTIQNVVFNPTVGTSSSLTLTVGTSTSAVATSSTMMTVVVPAGSTGYPATWDPSTNNAAIPPGDWVVFGPGAGTAVTYAYTYTGTCSGLFQSL